MQSSFGGYCMTPHTQAFIFLQRKQYITVRVYIIYSEGCKSRQNISTSQLLFEDTNLLASSIFIQLYIATTIQLLFL